MDQKPGREQGPTAGHYSPDRRWWWNGREWQPVSEQTASHPLSSQDIGPGRWPYVVAGLALASAVALLIVVLLGVQTGFSGIERATRVTAPGTTQITLSEAGTYTISYEHQTFGNVGASFQVNGPMQNIPPEVSSMQLDLGSADFATPVLIHAPSGRYTYSVGSTEGVVVGVFSVDRPGTYSLASRYANGESQPQITLAIARGSPGDLFTRALLYFLGGFAAISLFMAALLIGALTLFFRIRARDRARAAGSLGAAR